MLRFDITFTVNGVNTHAFNVPASDLVFSHGNGCGVPVSYCGNKVVAYKFCGHEAAKRRYFERFGTAAE